MKKFGILFALIAILAMSGTAFAAAVVRIPDAMVVNVDSSAAAGTNDVKDIRLDANGTIYSTGVVGTAAAPAAFRGDASTLALADTHRLRMNGPVVLSVHGSRVIRFGGNTVNADFPLYYNNLPLPADRVLTIRPYNANAVTSDGQGTVVFHFTNGLIAPTDWFATVNIESGRLIINDVALGIVGTTNINGGTLQTGVAAIPTGEVILNSGMFDVRHAIAPVDGTTINGGTMRIAGAAAAIVVGGGRTTLNAGGTLEFAGASNGTVANFMMSGGTVVRTGGSANFAGTITVNSGAALLLNNRLDVVNDLTIRGGTVRIDAAPDFAPVGAQTIRLEPSSTLEVHQRGIVAGTWLLNLADAVDSTIRFIRWRNPQGDLDVGINSGGAYTKPMVPINLVFPPRDRTVNVTPATVIPVLTVLVAAAQPLLAADFRLDAETNRAWMLRVDAIAGPARSQLSLIPRLQLNGEVTPDTAPTIPVGTSKSFDVRWFGVGGGTPEVTNFVTTSFEVTGTPGCATVTYSSDIQTLTVRGNSVGTANVVLHSAFSAQALEGSIPLTFTIGGSVTPPVMTGAFDPAVPTITVGSPDIVTSLKWTYPDANQPITVSLDAIQNTHPEFATIKRNTNGVSFDIHAVAKGTTTITVRGHHATIAGLSKDVTMTVNVVNPTVVVPATDVVDTSKLTGVTPSGNTLTFANVAHTTAPKLIFPKPLKNDYAFGTPAYTPTSGIGWKTSEDASGVYVVFSSDAKVSGDVTATVSKAGLDSNIKAVFGMDAKGGVVGGSGGGCNTGYLPFIVLLAAPLFFLRKKD